VKRMKKYLSFSNAIAFIALFVALGGTVYAAGKLSGAQIKPNSLPGNRVVAGSITDKQVKRGSLTGKQIKPGSLTGKQVVGSSLTGVSASSLAMVQYTSVTIDLPPDESSGTGTARCPAGMKVIGGGALTSREGAFVEDSTPSAERDGWLAFGRATEGQLATMRITAICTPVASTTG
jgi:hypothetical protein